MKYEAKHPKWIGNEYVIEINNHVFTLGKHNCLSTEIAYDSDAKFSSKELCIKHIEHECKLAADSLSWKYDNTALHLTFESNKSVCIAFITKGQYFSAFILSKTEKRKKFRTKERAIAWIESELRIVKHKH